MLETVKEPIPRAEYPRPQFVRDQWLCLNGWWEFETDPGDSGWERGLHQRELADRILVPFCRRRRCLALARPTGSCQCGTGAIEEIPQEWSGQIVLLHFQAVDYEATVWVNGKEVGRHKGGFTPFHCDLTPVVQPGEIATIVIRARDPWWEPQPRGKQSREVQPHGVLSRRTTGIWQTVWLERAGRPWLRLPRLTPDVEGGVIRLQQSLSRPQEGLDLVVGLSDGQGEIVRSSRSVTGEGSPRWTSPYRQGVAGDGPRRIGTPHSIVVLP